MIQVKYNSTFPFVKKGRHCMFAHLGALVLRASIPECPCLPSDTGTAHKHLHYTHPICSRAHLQIVFSAKSNWLTSKGLLNIFSISAFFIVLSRYFHWWLVWCRCETEKFYVWIMNSHLPPPCPLLHCQALCKPKQSCISSHFPMSIFRSHESDSQFIQEPDLGESTVFYSR